MAEQAIAVDDSIPGMRVFRYDESSPIALRVRTATAMPNWIPFVVDVTREESTQVATTIEYGGTLYAIQECGQRSGGWQYDLIPWPPGELARRVVPLTLEYFQQLEAQERGEQAQRRRDLAVRSLGFLIAFLPASIQERISETYDYDAPGWTKINSALVGLLNLGIAVVFSVIAPITAGFQRGTIGPGGGLFGILVTFSPYLVVDSFVRFGTVMTGDQALGLLPLELVDRIVRHLRRGTDGHEGGTVHGDKR